MNITLENLPLYFLVLIGIGVGVVLIGILKLASLQEGIDDDRSRKLDESASVEELFSYFLQEQEKKNQDFIESIIDASAKEEKHHIPSHSSIMKPDGKTKLSAEQQIISEMIERYQAGETVEEIARSLKKGIGEVKLIISLYSMR